MLLGDVLGVLILGMVVVFLATWTLRALAGIPVSRERIRRREALIELMTLEQSEHEQGLFSEHPPEKQVEYLDHRPQCSSCKRLREKADRIRHRGGEEDPAQPAFSASSK